MCNYIFIYICVFRELYVKPIQCELITLASVLKLYVNKNCYITEIETK